MDNDTRCFVLAGVAFLTGLVVGLSSGLLLAPQSGTRTRRHLRTMMEDVGERAEEFVEDAKERVTEVKDRVSDMMERGKKIVG